MTDVAEPPVEDRTPAELGVGESPGSWWRGGGWWALLLIVVAAGFVGRTWNLDFDQGQHLHPDERHWALTSAELARLPEPDPHGTLLGPALDWLDGDRSAANVYRATNSFAYGPVMLAASRATAGWLHDGVVNGDQPAAAVAEAFDAIGVPLIANDGQPTFDSGYDVELVGRLLAALLDTLTIAIVGLIGRRFAGPAVGLIAATFYASCVLAIQHAHFLGSEPLLGLCSALLVLAMLHLDRGDAVARAARSGGVVGLTCGAALAAKLNAAGLVIVPVIGCAALLWRHRRRSDAVRLAALALGTLVAFRILDPGAFDGLGLRPSSVFLDDLELIRAQRHLDSPPAVQWANRTPIVQPIIWMFRFTVGPGILTAAAIGAAALTRQLRLARRSIDALWPPVVILATAVVPFGVVALTALPTGRYLIPMLPALCVIAGVGVAATWRWAQRVTGLGQSAARTLAVTPIALALLWGAGFVNGVYANTNTRVEASRWIAENVEPGSVLSSQAWDDGLPLRLPGIDVGSLRSEQLNMVGTDSPDKVFTVARQLGQIDYVVESSPRLWGVVDRIPQRFPSTINFFEALDSGELGFDRVATFQSRISLAGFSLDESTAEEAFSVYDHPEVRIWKKVRHVSYPEIVDVLDPAAAANALSITPDDAHAGGLLLTPSERAALADGPTYAERFDLGGPSWAHLIGWFLLLELFGMAAFVLFLPFLRDLPDAGLGVAKTLGLVVPACTLFIANAWLRIPLGRPLVFAVVVLVLLGSGALARRRLPELRRLWRDRRRILVAAESATVVAFGGLTMVRAFNPDLWHPARGGEKPFELAVLTAVLRTDSLPPYDAWFAGGISNYYYGGYLVLLAPARLLATAPALVMNIGPAVFASCAAGAAFSLGAVALAGATRSIRGDARALVAGVFSAIAVVALSNMAMLRRVVEGRPAGTAFDWWALSRVIPDSAAITEFPAWSLLFADLHPHLMDICLVLTLSVVAIATYHHLVRRRTATAIGAAALAGLLVGLVRATNTWDFPLVAGGFALAVLLAALNGASRRVCTGSAVVAAAIVVVVWSPYTRRGLVFDSGFDRSLATTPWSSWLQQFGLFAAASLMVATPLAVIAVQHTPHVWRRVRLGHLVAAGSVVVGTGVVLIRPGSAVGITAAALTATMLFSTWQSRPRQTAAAPIATILMAIGWAIQVGVEIVSVRNDGNRQNTVFKFWYQSWLLLAVGSAVVVAAALPRRRGFPKRLRAGLPAVAALSIVVVGALSTALFWFIAAPARLDDRESRGGLSLDGEAYLSADFRVSMYDSVITPADDLPLIEWLRSNVHGIQTVAEAPGDDYRWSGRVGWMTGLATPIGWQYHERQQRRAYGDAIDRRVTDLRALYTTTDPAQMARVLSDRQIDYVVYGTVERALATPESAAALEAFECFDVAARADDLFVARVDAACVSHLRPRR